MFTRFAIGGLLVISDVDDTIKKSNTPQFASAFPIFTLIQFLYYAATIFVSSPQPVPHMPKVYSQIKGIQPDTKFIYVSGSPSILRSHVTHFIDQFYPQGDIILPDGFCYGLAQDLVEHKLQSIEEVLRDNPYRHVICIGDSKQFDAEIYAGIYRRHPSRIAKILIRAVSPVGNARWDAVFEDVPRHKWCVSSNVEVLGDALCST